MPRRPPPLDAAAVLAGRVQVTAIELIDLIHHVNPTGHELGAREQERRYALKSRLQSLLVRRFGDELTIVPDPDRQGTVSILHGIQGRDACHAVLDALDEDARAWVQRCIDLGPPSLEAPPTARPAARVRESIVPPSAEATPESLVRRADRAVDAFDYERARRQLAQAVTKSGGASGPAEAFLSFLVETLGDDADALSLQAQLAPAAIADPNVRVLLAIAAARSGDEPRALGLVRGASEARAAWVFAALAARAIGAGDLDRATGHLGELRRRAPTHRSIEGLTGDIARARAAARGPAEAEVAALAAAGREAEAEAKAASVLACWPESEVARRVLRGAEERRRRDEAARLVAASEAAREREVAARARRDAERVLEVRELLQAPDPREGLLAYLDLEEGLRAADTEDRLRWLELSRGAPRARVEAVLALDRARERAAAHPEAARAILAPHLGALDRVPEARRLLRETEARIADRRVSRAKEALAAAQAALAAGRAEEALAALDDAALRDLPDRDRAVAETLRAEATPIAARQRRAAEVGRLRDAGRLFEARDLAAVLWAEAEGEARARWEAERRAIQAAIQRQFRVEVDEDPRPFDGGRDAFPELRFRATVGWLGADGRTFVLAECVGPHVVINVVDREGLVVRAVLLRLPAPFACWSVEVIGRALWLLSEQGATLVLSLDTWEVQRYRASLEHLAGGILTSLPLLPTATWSGDGAPPRPRFLWALVDAPGDGLDIRVFDLADRRPPRVLPGMVHAVPMPGTPAPRVASLLEDGMVLYEDRGTPAPEGRLAIPGKQVKYAIPRPDGRGFMALVEVADPGGGGDALGWVDLPLPGGARPPQIIEGANPEGAMIGRAAEEGIVAVSFFNREGQLELLALGFAEGAPDGPSPPPLALLWRVPCPTRRMVLMTDASGRRLIGYELRPDGPILVDVGRTPPAPPPWSFDGHKMIEAMDFRSCLRRNEAVQGVIKRTAELDPATAGPLLRNLTRVAKPKPLTILLATFEFEVLGASATAEMARALAWLAEHAPDLPDGRLLRAERLAVDGRWREVVDLLAPLAAASSPGSELCPYHAHHLTAFALLHLGDADRARETLDRAGTNPTPCPIAALRELCTPLPLLAEAWGPDRPLLVQLVGVARHADACFAAGDPGAALATLARDPFSTCGEVQILARLAEAWLAVPAPDRPSRRHKITALGRFVTAHAERRPSMRQRLILPGATWDDPRLDDVAARASAWLDAEG